MRVVVCLSRVSEGEERAAVNKARAGYPRRERELQ
jgi:hypothetical protein